MTTPKSLLAAAVMSLDDPADTDRIWRAMDHKRLAAAIGATPEGARLLAAAEVGLAVERLPEGWRLQRYGDGWWVMDNDDLVRSKKQATPIAAINAALEDTP